MIFLEFMWNVMAIVGILATTALMYVLWENLK